MRDFINDEPIDDVAVVLDLLYKRWGDSTLRCLFKRYVRDSLGRPSFVRVEHCHDFALGTITDFALTDSVVERLIGSRLIEGKPQWGYRDDHEFLITPNGRAAFEEALTRVDRSSDWWASAEHWYRHVSREPWVQS